MIAIRRLGKLPKANTCPISDVAAIIMHADGRIILIYAPKLND